MKVFFSVCFEFVNRGEPIFMTNSSQKRRKQESKREKSMNILFREEREQESKTKLKVIDMFPPFAVEIGKWMPKNKHFDISFLLSLDKIRFHVNPSCLFFSSSDKRNMR